MSLHSLEPIRLNIQPRMSIRWEEFLATTPPRSIALDGFVKGGPRFDPKTIHANFDHHDCVNRDATMSTAMQVYFALKGGIFQAFKNGAGLPDAELWINDPDQDTALAVWLLVNFRQFEGTQSIPSISRLLALNDRWDITGGAFPMNLRDDLVMTHNWVFEPYSNLRKSGALSTASELVIRDNITSTMHRLDMYLMGQAGRLELDTRHEVLFRDPRFLIVNEIGGNTARYALFSQGMNAFISLVTTRADGKKVYSIGRRSQFIPFPVEKLYAAFNEREGLTSENGWNGSTIVGGSSRLSGSGLSWEELRDITCEVLRREEIS